MHDDGALRAEPSVQMRDARDAVALLDRGARSSLHQMLRHVTLEVRQQLHLLLQLRRVVVAGEVSLLSFFVDEVNVAVETKENRKMRSVEVLEGSKDLHSVREYDGFCGIVEHHTHSFITQLIPEAILVAVVDPLADPEHRVGCRIAVLIAQVFQVTLQLCGEEISQLLVQHLQVHLLHVPSGRHHAGSRDCVVQVVLQERRLIVGFI